MSKGVSLLSTFGASIVFINKGGLSNVNPVRSHYPKAAKETGKKGGGYITVGNSSARLLREHPPAKT
jgi:hypothetical protein